MTVPLSHPHSPGDSVQDLARVMTSGKQNDLILLAFSKVICCLTPFIYLFAYNFINQKSILTGSLLVILILAIFLKDRIPNYSPSDSDVP